MKPIVIILFFLFISCNDSKKNTTAIKNIDISSKLYNKIFEYQDKHPIPKVGEYDKAKPPLVETSFIYIYEAKFQKENNETLLSITLYPTGISTYYDKKNIDVKINGIYKDNLLKPTYINDPFKLGTNFVKQYLNNNQDIEKFLYERDIIIDAMYDIDLYKIKDDKLIFYKVLKGNVQ
jgi:hypothetical protein